MQVVWSQLRTIFFSRDANTCIKIWFKKIRNITNNFLLITLIILPYMATQNLLEMRAIFVLIFTYSMPDLLVSAFDQSKTAFEYLALSKNDIRMNSRVQYKYVLESNFSNIKLESTNIDQVTNRSKRDITELVKNLKFLTSDQINWMNVLLNMMNAVRNGTFNLMDGKVESNRDQIFFGVEPEVINNSWALSFPWIDYELEKRTKNKNSIIIFLFVEKRTWEPKNEKNYKIIFVPIECAIIPHENEYLRKLNGILNSINEYGPAYLNQPKVDNKKYCSKSHHLIAKVRGAFDIFDMCFEITEMNSIRDMIEIAADKILDRNCHYCISSTLSFESCFSDHSKSFNQFTCSDGFKCAQDRIKTYKCDSEKDITALNIITKFLTNMTNLCSITNQTKSFGFVREWFLGIDLCLKERHHIGLKFTDAPPHFDYCAEIEDTYNCIKSNYKNILEALPDFRHNFEQFAREYNQYMRSCENQFNHNILRISNNFVTTELHFFYTITSIIVPLLFK
ncbi:hypothetical protein BpHYR1_002765 [Brachionus plicatilis]|uniref:Uncharacterized protein n=1 Tax=Brachionus plicatilis TaxID=10195 RepID=A0A3M7SZC4_BRAPC|nr:hypothetical protein BpHYR1_002765 [Brachionus plicatilis]